MSNWILAFGDSLTAGYHFRGHKFVPYSRLLQKLLRSTFKTIVVHENGASGKTASHLNECASKYTTEVCVCCREYLNLEEALGWRNTPGLTREEGLMDDDYSDCSACGETIFPGQLYCKSQDGDKKLFRCHVKSTPVRKDLPLLCIIMLGTNDMCMRVTADKIAADVKALNVRCHKRGVPTICIEVPPNAGTTNAFNDREYQSRHRRTNELLRTWASTCPACTFMAFPVPYDKSNGLWDDQLHMTEAGYNALAKALAPVVEKVLRARGLPVDPPEENLVETTPSAAAAETPTAAAPAASDTASTDPTTAATTDTAPATEPVGATGSS